MNARKVFLVLYLLTNYAFCLRSNLVESLLRRSNLNELDKKREDIRELNDIEQTASGDGRIFTDEGRLPGSSNNLPIIDEYNDLLITNNYSTMPSIMSSSVIGSASDDETRPTSLSISSMNVAMRSTTTAMSTYDADNSSNRVNANELTSTSSSLNIDATLIEQSSSLSTNTNVDSAGRSGQNDQSKLNKTDLIGAESSIEFYHVRDRTRNEVGLKNEKNKIEKIDQGNKENADDNDSNMIEKFVFIKNLANQIGFEKLTTSKLIIFTVLAFIILSSVIIIVILMSIKIYQYRHPVRMRFGRKFSTFENPIYRQKPISPGIAHSKELQRLTNEAC